MIRGKHWTTVLLIGMPGSLVTGCRATIDAMAHLLLLLIAALIVGAIAYGVTWVVTGRDNGLDPEEPDGRAVPLPITRPLTESDIQGVRFDVTLRGYRMDQVDAALRRSSYDLGYKDELIEVLEAELAAIRAGRTAEAEQLRVARESSQPPGRPTASPGPTGTRDPEWARILGDDPGSSGSDSRHDDAETGDSALSMSDSGGADSDEAAASTAGTSAADANASDASAADASVTDASAPDSPASSDHGGDGVGDIAGEDAPARANIAR